jgi:hypothetical protein
VDLNAIDALCAVLSVLKWLTELPKALKALEEEVEIEGEKLNLTHQQIDQLKKSIGQLKGLVGNAKTIFDAMTAPGSITRKIFGDTLVQAVVDVVNTGKTALFGVPQAATDFAPCSFESQGLFDIKTFGGVARTETHELAGTLTTVALDFAARKNVSLLGFQGHVLLHRNFSFGLTLTSFEVSNGSLIPAKPGT